MTPATLPQQRTGSGLLRRLPLIAIAAAALAGAFLLRDYLSFDALAENRERLLAFRDANYVLAAGSFIALYVVVVAFSLPGAAKIGRAHV